MLLLGFATVVVAALLWTLVIPWSFLLIASWFARRAGIANRKKFLKDSGHPPDRRVVGYFHPYCNAGGGGERVLWAAIANSQRTEENVVSVVYSGDTDASKATIMNKVHQRFGIVLTSPNLHFVFLQRRWLIEDTTWPRFTLFGQSLGSMVLAWDAMTAFIPHLYIDTMGYAFTFPVVSLIASIPMGAYVHYPTISTQMLRRVTAREAGVTNSSTISNSATLTSGKLIYYRILMSFYSRSLSLPSFRMVNSSWTQYHIDSVLKYREPILDLLLPISFMNLLFPARPIQSSIVVYPSCDTRAMSSFPLSSRGTVILSVAQFRPEKNHAQQIRAFADLYSRTFAAHLVLIGGARNDEDVQRVDELRRLARELNVAQHVTFLVNAPFEDVLDWMSKADVGISTMVDEHFGINIVELMAAGVIPVAHASGGPLEDIIVPFEDKPTGFHAETTKEFADVMLYVINMKHNERVQMATRARKSVTQRFSEAEFEKAWNASGWRRFLEEGYMKSL